MNTITEIFKINKLSSRHFPPYTNKSFKKQFVPFVD